MKVAGANKFSSVQFVRCGRALGLRFW